MAKNGPAGKIDSQPELGLPKDKPMTDAKDLASLYDPNQGIEPPFPNVLNLLELSLYMPANVVTS
jgi:hypothetical protein